MTVAFANSDRRLWSWNLKLPANPANGTFLDFAVARHAGDLPIGRIEPDRMRPTLAKENTSLLAQVPLEFAELHASANSKGFVVRWETNLVPPIRAGTPAPA